jgi:hypothetical protein
VRLGQSRHQAHETGEVTPVVNTKHTRQEKGQNGMKRKKTTNTHTHTRARARATPRKHTRTHMHGTWTQLAMAAAARSRSTVEHTRYISAKISFAGS